MATAITVVPSQGVSPAAAGARLLFVDNIRTVLITLVVVGHLVITYGGAGIGDWYYKETGRPSDVFNIVMLPLGVILNASMLGLFCFIAGYFTPRAYDRKGAPAFLLDRVKRLAIPLAFYELLIDPAISYFRDVHQGSFQGSFATFLRAVQFAPLKSIATGPVWFLLMLLIFSVAYVAWRLMYAALGRRPRPAARPAPGNGALALFAIALGFLTFAVRVWAHVGTFYEPWHQEFAHYPQYVCMFGAGTLAYRGDWLATYPAARARLWRWLMPLIVVSLGAVVAAAGAFSGAMDERVTGGPNALSLAFSMWEAWTCVTIAIVMLAWFRARFDRQGPLAREMAASAFAVYVLHPAIIVPLALVLSGLAMNLSLKFLLVTPIAVALCYVAAGLLRRLPGVRHFV